MRPDVAMPLVSIAVTRHDEPDWLVLQALESLAIQRGVSGEVIFLDQRTAPELAGRVKELATACIDFCVHSVPPTALSFARNEALRLARHQHVLFLDADAIADPAWARELVSTLDQPAVGVAGCRILPRWHVPPLLISRARVVWEQYSLVDHGETEKDMARVVGAGFGLHARRLGDLARFDERLGRRPGSLLGGEESDLCRRCRAAGLLVRYNGRARIWHQVLPERVRYRWVLRRLFYAGVGRAAMGGAPSPSHRPGLWDWIWMPLVLPCYSAGYLVGRVRRAGKG